MYLFIYFFVTEGTTGFLDCYVIAIKHNVLESAGKML